ncbi:MAG: UPF0175 family protein [Leptospiraceae bacterium]|nr:UPF0175 family protein [Leptospiraceae bacterium]
MKTITIQLPDMAFSSLRKSQEELAIEMKHLSVVKWFELGLISQNKAAEICEMSRWEFLRLLSQYKVSILHYTENELDHELEILSRASTKSKK